MLSVLISLPLPLAAALLPIRVLLSLNFDIISLRGIKSGRIHQDPRTVAAQVDSSVRECRIFDTVSPPRENARSTSVEVAKFDVVVRHNQSILSLVIAYLVSTRNQVPCEQEDGQLRPLLATRRSGPCSSQLERCSSTPQGHQRQWTCQLERRKTMQRNLTRPSAKPVSEKGKQIGIGLLTAFVVVTVFTWVLGL
jgi:hypothetical protein